MTAAARADQRRRALEIVPDTEDSQPTAHPGDLLIAMKHGADPADLAGPDTDFDDWRAKTVLTQWDPEHQLIGALMWLPAQRARPILELVPDTAIWRPITRWAYEIIRALVGAARDPDPVIVLRTAKHQPYSEALQPGQPPTPARHHELALYLAAVYTQTISPVAAPSYAREVLEEAYRRAFRSNGIRMQHLGECGAERELLTEQFSEVRDELADLWRRAEAAAQPGWARP